MYAIRRMHPTKNSKNWMVMFVRRGRKYQKTFSDGVYGGARKALAAAVTWRDRAIAKAEIVTLRQFCAIKRSNNTSGVPGVHFLKTRAQPLGLWQARVKLPDGRKVHRSFSVLRFGKAEAFRRAVAAVAEGINPRQIGGEARFCRALRSALCVQQKPPVAFPCHAM